MYGGKSVEYGTAEQVFRRPEHPYTWGLLGSMPRLDRDVRERLISIKGSPPSLINLPSGCAFHPRCPYAERDGIPCRTVVPELLGDAHQVACHLPSSVRAGTFATDIAPHL
jgi:peptide/nickel transport system ATP-binding protein